MSTNTGPAQDFRTVDLKKLVIPTLTARGVVGHISAQPIYNDPLTGKPTVLCIQTPVVRFPFPLSKQTGDDGKEKLSLSGSFDGYKTNELMMAFYKFAYELTEYLIHTASKNSEEWFDGEKYEPATCKALMNQWIKVAKKKEQQGKYDPTFKAMVRTKKEGGYWAQCFGPDGLAMDIATIPAGSRGVMKIKLSSVYLVNKKFGMTWDLEWVKITEMSTVGTVDYTPNLYGELPAPSSLPAPGPTEENNDNSEGNSSSSSNVDNLTKIGQEVVSAGINASGKREREGSSSGNENSEPQQAPPNSTATGTTKSGTGKRSKTAAQ